MRQLSSLLLIFILVAVVATPRAQAQPSSSATPPHVATVDGRATLVRDVTAEPLHDGMPLMNGDRLEAADGRVTILFGDGSAIDVDRHTRLDILADGLVRLFVGRVRVITSRGAEETATSFRVDTPGGAVQIETTGEYVITASPDASVRLAVVRGSALLSTDHGWVRLRAGEHTTARLGEMPAPVHIFNSAIADDFDRWSFDRRQERLGPTSSRYLPRELGPYAGTLDRFGAWTHDATYGYVWQPYAVSGWKPYWNGAWRHLGALGWTWIGFDAWAWPTHHFGRWAYFPAQGWAWIPASRWAPAWVAWATAPGYFAWCPLGIDGRPVIAVNNFGILNIYQANGIYDANGLNIYQANGIYDPWRGWTAAPAHAFARRTVAVTTIDRVATTARPAFVSQPVAPTRPAAAAPSIPLRSPGPRVGVAMPRGSVPSPPNGKTGSDPFRASQSIRGPIGSPRGASNPTDAAEVRPGSAPGHTPVRMRGGISSPSPVPGRSGPIQRSPLMPPAEPSPGTRDVPMRQPSPSAVPRGVAVPRGSASPFDAAQGRPFDAAQGRPFDGAPGRPSRAATGRPFGTAQGRVGHVAPPSITPALRPAVMPAMPGMPTLPTGPPAPPTAVPRSAPPR